MLQNFGYTQKLEVYDPLQHQVIHRNNILYCHKQYTYILSLFKSISSSLLHPSLMMPRDVVVDHSSKNFSYNADTSHCFVHTFQMVNIIHRHYGFFNFVNLLLPLSYSLVFLHGRHYNVDSFLYLTGLFTPLN